MPTKPPARPAVLVVGDDLCEQKLMARALRRRDETLVFAADGQQALDYLMGDENGLGHLPSLVILGADLAPPGPLEVVRQIRASEPIRDLPVVMLVAEQPAWGVARAYASGVNSCILHSQDAEVFVRTMEQAALYWLSLNARSSARGLQVALEQVLPLAAMPAPAVGF